MEYTDYTEKIVIGGEEYPLLFNVAALNEITRRYGGIAELETLVGGADSVSAALDEAIWLILLFVNQHIKLHNFKNPDEAKSLVSSEYFELITSPDDFSMIQEAVSRTLNAGMRRFVSSAADRNEDPTTDG